MRNYIIFYILLSVFIAGGIYLTTYTLEKEKKAKFEATDHHQRISQIIEASDQLKASDLKGQSLVLFSWLEYNSKPEDFKNLNDLLVVFPENVKVLTVSNADKEYGESYFIRKKIEPQFTVLYKQQVLKKNMDDIVTNFYEADSLKFRREQSPVTVVVKPDGKVKFAKIGSYPELMKDVKEALEAK